MTSMHCSLLSLGCAFGFSSPEDRSVLTALHAFKIAQRRLRPEVRAKLLCVVGAKTSGLDVPSAWRFMFYDAATEGQSRVVTVAARTSSEHPDTLGAFNLSRLEHRHDGIPIPQNKWVVDSYQAHEKARGVIKHKGIQGWECSLIQPRGAQEPLWTLRYSTEADQAVAYVQVGAKTGAVKLLDKMHEPHEMVKRGA